MKYSRATRRLLIALGVAAVTAGGVASSSATFVATFPVSQGFSTKADWVDPEVSITAPTDGQRMDATPLISGQAGTAPGDEPQVEVSLWVGQDPAGGPIRTLTAPVSAAGTWSLTLAALDDGVYTVRARQRDASGNSAGSGGVSFVVDGTAPAPTIVAPAQSATVDDTPDLSGAAGNATGDDTNLTLRLWHDATGNGTADRTLSVTRNGATWSTTIAAALDPGTWSARVVQDDDVGNSGSSALRTFTVSGGSSTLTGLRIRTPQNNALLTDVTPRIAGFASNARGASNTVTLRLYSGDTATGTPVRTITTTRSGRFWSINVGPGLPDGRYTARAEQADGAGNRTLSDPRSFTVDSHGPKVVIDQPLQNAVVGVLPSISGHGGVAAGDLGQITVRIYDGDSTNGSLVQTRRVTANPVTGAWSVTARRLTPGQYTIQASQDDRAGNTGLSAPVTVLVGPDPPVAREIAARDGGGDDGTLESRDRIMFTYSLPMNPASMLAGWTGSATPVKVRFYNGGNVDGFTLLNAAGTAILGITRGDPNGGVGVDTGANYVTGRVTFDATMALSGNRRVVTVTLGRADIPSRLRDRDNPARNMAWAVNTAARDVSGRPVAAGTVRENDGDQDF